jgi:bifunctional non-homologous end joining protein LigD
VPRSDISSVGGRRVPGVLLAQARKASQPDWVDPMLATLTKTYFSDPKWIFERKLDGERVLTFVKRGKPRLFSRNRIDLNGNYPELVEAFERCTGSSLIADGEVVAFEGKQTSFGKLQPRMMTRNPSEALRKSVPVFYYLFDLLYIDGYDVRLLPVRDRKKLLREAVDFENPLRFMTHRVKKGEAYHDEACRKGWEGVIAKRADSLYVSGRSKDWLKFKCVNEQELVIVGYTNPSGSRTAFGSLLVGYYENGELHYAGKVGTGYSVKLLSELGEQLRRLEQDTSPVVERVRQKGAHWVKPKLVAQFGFTEWTRDGKLRHPRFLGLRRDKKATEVVRETPQ